MGNLSCTYAVQATRDLSLASRFDFNAYSYESEVVLGCELWRRRDHARPLDHTWADGKLSSSSFPTTTTTAATSSSPSFPIDATVPTSSSPPDQSQSELLSREEVIKARLNPSTGNFALLWEGRVKELLFTLGSSFNLRSRQPFHSVGLEIQYSS